MKNAPSPLKVMLVALFTLLAGFGSALAPRPIRHRGKKTSGDPVIPGRGRRPDGPSAEWNLHTAGRGGQGKPGPVERFADSDARDEPGPAVSAAGGISDDRRRDRVGRLGEGRRIQSDLPDPHRSRHHRRHHVPHVPPAPPAVGRVEICCKHLSLPLPPGEGWGEDFDRADGLLPPHPRPLPCQGEGILSATWQGKVKPSRCPELGGGFRPGARTAPRRLNHGHRLAQHDPPFSERQDRLHQQQGGGRPDGKALHSPRDQPPADDRRKEGVENEPADRGWRLV